MIQDISPRIFNNSYMPDKRCDDDSIVFCFRGREVLIRDDGNSLFFPRKKDLPADISLRYLFSIDDEAFFLAPYDEFKTGKEDMPDEYDHDTYLDRERETHAYASLDKAFVYMGMQALRRTGHFSKYLMFALFTAHQLYDWYDGNRFCGACATPMEHAEHERAMQCPKCRRMVYPKIVPAVIVAVTNGDEILLTKYAGRPYSFYALVAGFTEIGETLEDTVRREVMEEVGLKVRNIRYYKSQPWAIADDILTGFFCDVDGDTTIRLDTSELKEGRWFKREEVIGQPDDFSLTNEMMMLFRDGKEPR